MTVRFWHWLFLAGGVLAGGWMPAGLPASPEEGPVLCVRDYLKPAQGAAVLAAAAREFDTKSKWETYAALVRRRIREGADLAVWPTKTPLNPIVSETRWYDGYTVQNVAIETVPGVFAAGNLYRPLRPTASMPAVLATHGHTGGVKTEADWARHGRFHEGVQKRAAVLARMGAVVLTLDMFGYGDSLVQFGPEAHRRPFSMTMQIWNAKRAVDFLESLEGVDPKRIAVTGESGGGTQSFLLTALDERVALSVPVAMVSSYFFGGCPCESGKPIHRSDDHFASNAMIAALAAPRPMLLVSDGGDWTRFTPETEYPYLQGVYELFGVRENVANVHLPDEGHDYGPSKRTAMYEFVAARFGLKLDGDESCVTLEMPAQLKVFATPAALPAHAVRTPEAAEAALKRLQ